MRRKKLPTVAWYSVVRLETNFCFPFVFNSYNYNLVKARCIVFFEVFVKTIYPVGTRYTLCKCVSELVEIANCISSTFDWQTPLVSKNFRGGKICFLNVIFLNVWYLRRCKYSSGYQERLIDANR